MSRLGKPYQTGIFTVHKLIGLAMGVFLMITVARVNKIAPLTGLEISLLVVTVMIFVGLVVAGGLLSIAAAGGLCNASPVLLTALGLVHKIFPYLAVILTGFMLSWLLNGKL